MLRTVVRETILRRRRSRVPWIYLVYHPRRRPRPREHLVPEADGRRRL